VFPVPDTRRPWHQFVVEFGLVTGVLVAVALWYRLCGAALAAVGGRSSLLVSGVGFAALFLAGLGAGTVAYATARDIDAGVRLPSPSAWRAVVAAAVVPPAFVALTKLVGVATGVPYNTLTKTAIAADPPLGPVALLAGLTLSIRVPALVLVCQVLVQRGFERSGGDAWAVVATTLVAAFALVGTAGSVTPAPDAGKLAGLALVAGSLLCWDYASRSERRTVRRLGPVPFTLVLVLLGLAALVSVRSFAGACFAFAQVGTFAVAAEAFRRTDSLLPPALAYASLVVANRVVVVGFEAGLQNW